MFKGVFIENNGFQIHVGYDVKGIILKVTLFFYCIGLFFDFIGDRPTVTYGSDEIIDFIINEPYRLKPSNKF